MSVTVMYADEDDGSGMILFAGMLLGLAGFMRIVDSIWAFRYSGPLPQNLQNSVLGSNLTTYAWVWLVVGVVLIVASMLVFFQSEFGRWIGIFAAAIAALSAITFMPYYPVWALLYIALAVVVVYALARYGGRVSAVV